MRQLAVRTTVITVLAATAALAGCSTEPAAPPIAGSSGSTSVGGGSGATSPGTAPATTAGVTAPGTRTSADVTATGTATAAVTPYVEPRLEGLLPVGERLVTAAGPVQLAASSLTEAMDEVSGAGLSAGSYDVTVLCTGTGAVRLAATAGTARTSVSAPCSAEGRMTQGRLTLRRTEPTLNMRTVLTAGTSVLVETRVAKTASQG